VTVRVKICGVTRVEDAELAVCFGADFIGLNFYAPSPRSLSLKQAREIRAVIGSRCEVVGVFVNAPRAHIREHLSALNLDLLQFHGDEEAAALEGWPVKVIRALRLKAAAPVEVMQRCFADYLLFDTFHPQLFGGTGDVRNLDDLKNLDLDRIFISGGLSPANVADAARLNPYAVDVASGVESVPGVKDADKLRSFIANAKSSR